MIATTRFRKRSRITRYHACQPAQINVPTVSNVPDLALWLEADFLGLSDGTAVSSWTDQSPNARHAIQPTGGSQPLYKTNIVNGHAAIRFDGSNDVLAAPMGTVLQRAQTIFFVAKHISLPNPYNPEVSFNNSPYSGGTDQGAPHYVKSNSTAAGYPYYNGGSNTPYDGVGSYSTGTPFLIAFNFPAYGTPWTSYKNGTAEASLTRTTFLAATYLQVGGQICSGINRPSNVDICEVAVYSRTLTTAERQRIEDFLGAKYNITITH